MIVHWTDVQYEQRPMNKCGCCLAEHDQVPLETAYRRPIRFFMVPEVHDDSRSYP